MTMAVTARDQINNGTTSAGAVLRRFGRRFSGRQDVLVATLPGLVEILLAVAIGVILVSAVFAFLAPLPVPKTLPERMGAVITDHDPVVLEQTPFRVAAIEAVAPEELVETADEYEETTLNLKLHGVYTLGDVPSAFIQTPDGRQKTVTVDEEIWNGATLAAVYADYVVIVSGGVRETLTLENRDPSQRQAQNQQPQASTPTLRNASKVENAVAPSKGSVGLGIGNVVRVDVQPKGGKFHFFVSPGSDRAAFDAAGLQAGDQIIAVNNRRVGDIITEAERFASLANAQSVSLLVERDGVSLPIDLKLSSNKGRDSEDE